MGTHRARSENKNSGVRFAALVFVLVMFSRLAGPAHAGPAECTEAEALAADVSGEALPPPALVAEIASDLTAIRSFDPRMDSIRGTVEWDPGYLILLLSEEAANQFKSGVFHGLDSLNAIYGPVEMFYAEFQTTYALDLVFSSCLNPFGLIASYESVPGVLMAQPGLIGGHSTDVTPEAGRQYTFWFGWGDCLAGCIYNHYWTYSIAGDVVTLVQEYGDSLPVESTTWSRIKLRAGDPRDVGTP